MYFCVSFLYQRCGGVIFKISSQRTIKFLNARMMCEEMLITNRRAYNMVRFFHLDHYKTSSFVS